VTYDESLQRLVDHATRALSCDLGFVFVPERDLMLAADARCGARVIEQVQVHDALAQVAARGRFPSCVQRAPDDELPPPLSSEDGVLAYYLLELSQPLPGVLLLLHTDAAAARGFTSLCQSLGAKLVEASVPLLTAALLRDRMNHELELAAAAARRDPLTSLANRLAWDEAMAAAQALEGAPSSIVQLDCGGLKLINDTFGHHVGDDLLRRVATALRSSVREEDVVARLGGDEFALLLRGADEEMTQTIVRRIEEAVACSADPDQPPITLAIGVATERRGDLVDAQHRADAQMLEAKRTRRARRATARLAQVD
jgi:diguanylate cyclase (GGDEF)-like protein